MSILNIALCGVSLARDEMDLRNEKLLRRCSNMKEIREKADGDGKLKPAIQSSLKTVTCLFQDRFEKLSLKGQKFKIFEAASDEGKAVFLSNQEVQKAPPSEVHKEQALEEIQSKAKCLPTHIQQLVNSAIHQVKSVEGLDMLMQAAKGGSFGVDVVRAALDLPSCVTCKSPRASLVTFKKMMWLPDPQYKDASKEHYKTFEDLFGKNTSKIDRPSAKSNVDDKSKHLTKKESVRDAIECVNYKKWRSIFAATKPTAAQMEQLSEIADALQ
ncbi:hypothetical protein AWC38_SpisGene17184 [Stylophora pistillata]|uniref:Uncharacterized protein n=1 Tax=Stylophora pistillata TaxID=50429 RepID=A0A2B4RNR3_STYPI|nr:hypothetical protein AWC38_SpisGene17184 [Stylophora pistillata]